MCVCVCVCVCVCERTTALSACSAVTSEELQQHLTVWDMKRIESYARNLVDYHLILDLVPTIARLFFARRFTLSLSYTQVCVRAQEGAEERGRRG